MPPLNDKLPELHMNVDRASSFAGQSLAKELTTQPILHKILLT